MMIYHSDNTHKLKFNILKFKEKWKKERLQ